MSTSPVGSGGRSTKREAGSIVIDDYANPGYVFIQSDAIMSAVLGETDYRTTGFNNLNIVSGGRYCAGCNGSFELSFATTSAGSWISSKIRVAAFPAWWACRWVVSRPSTLP